MVIQMRVIVDDRNVRSLFNNLPKNASRELGRGMFNVMKSYQRSLRYSLMRTSKRLDGEIWNGIKAKKVNDTRSFVTMPQEGIWLDSMRPHWVSIYKARKIARWADARGYKGNAVYVRPHPFIDAGLIRGREGREKILQEAIDLAIKKSKR